MTYKITVSDEIISEETGYRQDDVMDTSEELSWLLAPGIIRLQCVLKEEMSFQFMTTNVASYYLVEICLHELL